MDQGPTAHRAPRLEKAVSAASIWGLAEPKPVGLCLPELRLAPTRAPRSARGSQERVKFPWAAPPPTMPMRGQDPA